MASEEDILNIINLLDGTAASGAGRIRLDVTEEQESGTTETVHHHGRCDVGSAWAKGTVKNYDCIDIPNSEMQDNK